MATKRPADLNPKPDERTDEEKFEDQYDEDEDDLYLAPDGNTMATYHEGDEDDEDSIWYQNPPKVYGIPVTELNGTDDPS